jgi:hypothetical protein
VIDEFPQFPVATTYDELKQIFAKVLAERGATGLTE